ncbi:MAG: dehalogenase [Dehalogenimonas sp.]
MWPFIALIVGAAIIGLAWWLNRQNINVKWYEWLIGLIGVLLLMFSLQNYFGAIEEWQQIPANRWLGYFGVPAILLIALAVSLVIRHRKTTGT